METPEEIRTRWRYLRDLLIEQLGRFEDGSLQLHSDDENVSVGAILKLKRHILDFDELIARSEARSSADREQTD
jgi:hypothetical protein